MTTHGVLEFIVCVLFAVLPGHRKIFRGRIFTRPVTKFFRRFCRPLSHGLTVRLLQLTIVGDLLVFFVPGGRFVEKNHVWFALLYLDDWATGDDDEWNRFKEWCRNRVKWLMELPAPPVEDAA